MFKRQGVTIIEFFQGGLRATCAGDRAEGVIHREILFTSGQEDRAVEGLRSLAREGFASRRTVVLISRAVCLMGTFRLPSKDLAEILSMTEFQFTRSTPHKRDDMVVDVKVLEKASASQSLVSGAMAVRETLRAYSDICQRAGVKPDVMTINTQRLLPLARNIWGNALNGDGRVLGLAQDGMFWLGFFARGDMLFSREEQQGNDRDSALGAFIEYCHKEFPGTPVKEGLLLGSSVDVGMTRTVAGVPIGAQALASVVRTTQEQAAFELSPVAYLDLLLAKDEKSGCFDFSPDEVKAEREHVKACGFFVHAVLIALMFAAGFLLLGISQWNKKVAEINGMRSTIAAGAAKVKSLEEKAGVIINVQKYFSERALASSAFEDIARLLPKDARLNQMDLKEGVLSLKGEAASLDAVQEFQRALGGIALFRDARLEGIDKRPNETAQTVMFRMTMRLKK